MAWLCDGIYASNWRTGWGGYLIAGPNTGVLAIAKAGYLPKFFQKPIVMEWGTI